MEEASLILQELENDLAELLMPATKAYFNYHCGRLAIKKRYLKEFKIMHKSGLIHYETYYFLKQFINFWYDDPFGAHDKVMTKWFG